MLNKVLLILVFGLIFSESASAAGKDTYPKLANYYLEYFANVHPSEADELTKWDLIIAQNDITISNPNFIENYKTANPNGIVLAYIYSAMGLRAPNTLYNKIDETNLWLRDRNGQKLEIWQNIFAANVTKDSWHSMNLNYIESKFNSWSWDGVMYDVVDASISHYSSNGIDINGDGQIDDQTTVNSAWQQGMSTMFSKTRARFPNKIILMNGNSIDSYQPNTNGRIFENFPTPWEGNGSWQASMYQYLNRLPGKNHTPTYYVINATTNNTGRMSDYKKMRFGLSSTLLGDGYFSFDHGDQAHEQLWWYDEYDMKLGYAQSSYYNLLDVSNNYIKPGLWRRDFDNGVAIVNSTSQDQLYVFKNEEFEKLKGQQDPAVNNGTKVNYIKLKANDGIIMKAVRSNVVGQVFNNGDFLRVFESTGKQKQSGFFAYKSDVPANSRILSIDLDGNKQLDRISEDSGRLKITGPGRKTITIAPYGNNFKGKLSFTVFDFNKDGSQEIIIVPLTLGGPQVVIYSQTGKKLSAGFFAFDKDFRGGVNIAAGDVDGDGKGEIIVTPAKNLAPTVKIFSEKGTLVGSFFAYDKNFRGGVNISVGDLNQDGRSELVTGAASSGPHIRIFTSTGKLLGQFMAYDQKIGGGVRVMVSDSDGDGKAEILAGTSNF